MKNAFRRKLILLALLLPLPCTIGCSSEEPAPTPQQMEEMRQKQLERGKSFAREG